MKGRRSRSRSPVRRGNNNDRRNGGGGRGIILLEFYLGILNCLLC